MSAALPARVANAVASWSWPVVTTAGTRSRAGLPMRDDLGEVLVAAAGKADEVERRVATGPVDRPVQRVRRLERRDEAPQAREETEHRERVGVGDGDVRRAAGVAQVGVLGARAGVVEARRHRVRLGDLAVL